MYRSCQVSPQTSNTHIFMKHFYSSRLCTYSIVCIPAPYYICYQPSTHMYASDGEPLNTCCNTHILVQEACLLTFGRCVFPDEISRSRPLKVSSNVEVYNCQSVPSPEASFISLRPLMAAQQTERLKMYIKEQMLTSHCWSALPHFISLWVFFIISTCCINLFMM